MAAKKYHQNHNVNEVTDEIKPPVYGFAITKHDTNELEYITRRIYVGTPGDVAVLYVGATQPVIYKNASGYISGCFTKVMATGTTALDIVGEV